jgi:hypothetical protein
MIRHFKTTVEKKTSASERSLNSQLNRHFVACRKDKKLPFRSLILPKLYPAMATNYYIEINLSNVSKYRIGLLFLLPSTEGYENVDGNVNILRF